MTDLGPTVPFGDGRTWRLPHGWSAVEDEAFDVALQRTTNALGDPQAVERVGRYYDPDLAWAGATFLDAGPNPDDEIGPADLWALSTLSIKVPPLHGRRLMRGDLADHVRRGLSRLPTTRPLSDIDTDTFDRMWDLHHAIRVGLPALGQRQTNQWVFAAKLCARKRPELFPVRDSVVFTYLARDYKLGGKAGQLGQFGRDIPVMAYLITNPDITAALSHLRNDIGTEHAGARLDHCDLRLLDVALWTHALHDVRSPATGDALPGEPIDNTQPGPDDDGA